MWTKVDDNLSYYLSPNLNSSGKFLIVGITSLFPNLKEFDSEISSDSFKINRQQLLEQVNRGYTLALFVFPVSAPDYLSQYHLNLSQLARLIKVLDMQIIMLVFNDYDNGIQQAWEQLDSLNMIKKSYYVGQSELEKHFAIRYHSQFYFIDEFFPAFLGKKELRSNFGIEHHDVQYRYYYQIILDSPKQLTTKEEVKELFDGLRAEIQNEYIRLTKEPIIYEQFNLYQWRGKYYLEIDFLPEEGIYTTEFEQALSKITELILSEIPFKLEYLDNYPFKISGKLVVDRVIKLKEKIDTVN